MNCLYSLVLPFLLTLEFVTSVYTVFTIVQIVRFFLMYWLDMFDSFLYKSLIYVYDYVPEVTAGHSFL